MSRERTDLEEIKDGDRTVGIRVLTYSGDGPPHRKAYIGSMADDLVLYYPTKRKWIKDVLSRMR